MIYILHILSSILISSTLLASDYNYNMQGIGTANTKSMTLKNNTQFLLYENNILSN